MVIYTGRQVFAHPFLSTELSTFGVVYLSLGLVEGLLVLAFVSLLAPRL